MKGISALKTINYFSFILMILTFFATIFGSGLIRWGIYTFFLILFGIIFVVRKLYITDYEMYREDLKKGLAGVVAVMVFTCYKWDIFKELNLLSPFVMVYLVSAVTLLRTLRQKEKTKTNKLIGSLNYVYFVLLLTAAVLAGVESTRKAIVEWILVIWNNVPELVFVWLWKLFYLVMYILGLPFVWLVNKIRSRPDRAKEVWDSFNDSVYARQQWKPKPFTEDFESAATTIFQSGIFKWIFWIVLVAILVLVIKKMWDSGTLKRKKNENFEEEKEFLIGMKRKDERKVERKKESGIPFFFGQRTNNGRIRSYYQKLLRFCQQKAVQLLGSDTSLDVNRKCRFDEKIMDSMRSTYIKARYSGQEVEKAELDEFVRNYKQISKK